MVNGENCMHEVASKSYVSRGSSVFLPKAASEAYRHNSPGNHFYSFLIMLREDEVAIANSGEVETFGGKTL